MWDCRGVSSLCGLYCTIVIFYTYFFSFQIIFTCQNSWATTTEFGQNIPQSGACRKYYVQTSCCGKTYKLDNEVGRAIEKGKPVVISQNDLEYEGQTPVIKKCNYCGYVTEENFEYCPKCGNKLN